MRLSSELIDQFREPISIVVATRDGALRPAFTRAFGISGESGGEHVTVFVPEIVSAQMLVNLRENGSVAVQVANWRNFRAYQLKGTFLDSAPAGAEAEVVVAGTQTKVAEIVGQYVGERFATGWKRFVTAPAIAVRFTLRDVYEQSPGPNAGSRLAG